MAQSISHASWGFLSNWQMLDLLNAINKEVEQLPAWKSIIPLYEKSNAIINADLFSDVGLNEKSWEEVNYFYAGFTDLSKKEKEEYLKLVKISDEKLNEFRGDPLNFDWEQDFRPLRLSREEDWSDWLAFLIKRSDGHFITHLFGFAKTPEVVLREYVAENARADIVIKWENEPGGTHIEVKIGDPNLEKTHDTSTSIRNQMPEITEWEDYILLLESQLDYWCIVDNKNSDKGVRITSKTWTDVSIAIRKCLYEQSEDLLWRSLAYAFTGCIEVKLHNGISIPGILSDRPRQSIYSQINILTRSLQDGKAE